MAARGQHRLHRVVDRANTRRQPQLERRVAATARRRRSRPTGSAPRRAGRPFRARSVVVNPARPDSSAADSVVGMRQVWQQRASGVGAARGAGSAACGSRQVEPGRQRKGHGLGRVDRAAAAERDQRIGVRLAGRPHRRGDRLGGRVLADPREHPRCARTKSRSSSPNSRALPATLRVRDDERAPCPEPLQLRFEVLAPARPRPSGSWRGLAYVNVPAIGRLAHARRGYRWRFARVYAQHAVPHLKGSKEFEMTTAPARVNVMEYSGKAVPA